MTRPLRLSALLAVLTALLTSLLLAPTAPAGAVTATQQVRFVTANVDFTLSAAKVKSDLHTRVLPYADVVLVQEAKAVNLATLVDQRVWLVRQGDPRGWSYSTSDEKGSALLVRRSAIRATGDYGLVWGTDSQGCGIQTRWIAKMKIQLTNGRWVRIASLHMPPRYCQTGPGGPYDVMAGRVVDFVRRTPMYTVLGGDWNKVVDADPNGIAAATGLEANGPNSGTRIDGFMYTRSLANCCLTVSPKGYSDHAAVRITIGIPGV